MGGGAIWLARIYQVPVLAGRGARERSTALRVVIGVREEFNALPHRVGEALKCVNIDSPAPALDVREPVFPASHTSGQFFLR